MGGGTCLIWLEHSTEEVVHPSGDLLTLVGQRAMTAVCQMDLGGGHDFAIPQLTLGRKQDVVFPANDQRRRFLRAQVVLGTLECGTIGADVVEQIERNIRSAWALQRGIVDLP